MGADRTRKRNNASDAVANAGADRTRKRNNASDAAKQLTHVVSGAR
jgi:hypothetical protein